MKRFMTIATAILLAGTSLMAMPAWKGKLKKQQKDGTTVTYYLQGDEWSHRLISTDGLLLEENEQGSLCYRNASLMAHDPQMRSQEEWQYIERNKDELLVRKNADPTPNPSPARGGENQGGVSPARGGERLTSPRKAKASDYQIGSFPTKGDAHAIIILADFSDKKMTFSREYHQRMMNEEGFSDYEVEGDMGFVGSARDYFIAQSKGQFQPTFDVVGPVHLTHNVAYYGRNDAIYGQDQDAEKMIVEACRLADTELDVDFSQYDYDHDGYVDMVYVVFAGYGENAGGGADTVWPKKWNLTKAGYDLSLDNRKIDVFACSSELFGNTGEQTASIAQFCHEFGHVLGFADHYNTMDSRQYNLGAYDLMDYGAYNNDSRTPPSYNAFERMSVGWMTPDELTDVADGIRLENINESNQAYRLSTERNPLEFYLLENRQQTGWDEFIPGSGLMITHVDFDMQTWNSNLANNEASHRRFYLECADNEPGYNVLLEKYTEEYDLFPYDGNDSFTDSSLPKAKPYTGETLDKWVTNIKNEDGVVTFDFMENHLKAPSFLTARDVTDQSFTAHWTNNDDRTESYNLRLTHLMREQDQKRPVDEDFHLMADGSKEQPGSADCASNLDEYMVSKGWTGEQIYMAGGAMMMGKTGIDGWLKSPKMNFASFDRDFAVLLKVSSATGSQPALTVSANGLQAKHRLTSTPRMYLYQFSGAGVTSMDITISINKERAFIDSLIIIRGGDATSLYPNAKVVNVTGEVASTEDEPFEQQYIPAEQQTFTDIENEEYELDALDAGECYRWEVQAVSGDQTSRYSNSHQLIVSSDYVATGIGEFEVRDARSVSRGLQIPSDWSEGCDIYNMNGARAKTMNTPGVYIVKQRGNTWKMIVK